MNQPGVKWWVTQGQHVQGGARKESHPPPGLDHPGERVAESSGLERPGESKAAKRRPPWTETAKGRGPAPPEWNIRCRTRRQEGGPEDWSARGRKANGPGLDQPGLNKKEEPTMYQPQYQQGTSSWDGANGAVPQWMQGHKPPDWSIR